MAPVVPTEVMQVYPAGLWITGVVVGSFCALDFNVIILRTLFRILLIQLAHFELVVFQLSHFGIVVLPHERCLNSAMSIKYKLLYFFRSVMTSAHSENLCAVYLK